MPLLLVLLPAAWGLDAFIRHELIYNSEAAGGYKVHRARAMPPEEVAVVGSSRAKCCIVPDSLGGPAFNYGLDGAGFDVVAWFLEKALQRPGHAPVLVNVDFHWWAVGIGDVNNYIAEAGDPAIRRLLGPRYEPRFRIPMLRFYGRLDVILAEYLKARFSVTEEVRAGAGLLLGQLPPARFQALAGAARAGRVGDFAYMGVDSLRLKRLEALLDAYPEHPVVFVVAPYHGAYLDGMGAARLAAARAWLQALACRTHVHVLDYAGMPLPDTLFF